MPKKKTSVDQLLRDLTREYSKFMRSWRTETDWVGQIETRPRFNIMDLLDGSVGFGSDDLSARLTYGTIERRGGQNWSLFTAFDLDKKTAFYRYWLGNSWSCRPGLTLVDVELGSESFIQITWTNDVARLEPKRLNGKDIIEITKDDIRLRDDNGQITAVAHSELIVVLMRTNDALRVTQEMVNLAREMMAEAA